MVLSTVVVVALVGFALAAVGAAFQDVLVPPGQLSKQHIKAMLKDPVLKRGVLYKPLSWLASNAHFFPFASPTSYGGGGVGRLLGGWTVPATGVPVVLQAMAVNEKGTESPVVFSTGFAEVFVKYADLIRSLVKDGHPVYTFDLRGQGFSSTLVDVGDGSGPEGRVVDLGSIEDYTRDLHSFVEDVVQVPIQYACLHYPHTLTPTLTPLLPLSLALLLCRCGGQRHTARHTPAGGTAHQCTSWGLPPAR